jgi:CRP/FNR family cyclic AMP-dependent transcriptional regulator
MPLSSSYLFKGLSESQLQILNEAAREIKIKKGQWLFQEGKSAERMYVLKSGAIEKLTRVNDDFELPISIIRSPGRCFGTSSLVPPYQYSLSARGAKDAVLFEIQREDLQQLTREDNALGYTIMANLAQHLLDRLKETRLELKIHFKSLLRSVHS